MQRNILLMQSLGEIVTIWAFRRGLVATEQVFQIVMDETGGWYALSSAGPQMASFSSTSSLLTPWRCTHCWLWATACFELGEPGSLVNDLKVFHMTLLAGKKIKEGGLRDACLSLSAEQHYVNTVEKLEQRKMNSFANKHVVKGAVQGPGTPEAP